MGGLSVWHWLIFLAVALLLFGGSGKISSIMGDVAKGIKSFKKGMAEDDETAKSTIRPRRTSRPRPSRRRRPSPLAAPGAEANKAGWSHQGLTASRLEAADCGAAAGAARRGRYVRVARAIRLS